MASNKETQKAPEAEQKPPAKNAPKPELVMRWDPRSGYLIPHKWTYPFGHSKKSYIAILFGLNTKYEFDRYFTEKHEFEIEPDGSDEHAQRTIGVGYGKEEFKDGMIIEERYSFKEESSITTKLVYYRVFLSDDGVWGERVSKSQIRESIQTQQQQLFQEIKNLMTAFGERFVLQTMKAILQEKERLSKNINVMFFSDLI
jgi:hypothetical protein